MDKSELTRDRVTTERAEVEIDGVGIVTIRGLTRFEFLLADKLHPDDIIKKEQFILSTAMVDPQMSPDDVAAWQKGSGPMEINEVAAKVNELSGIGKQAQKEAYKSV